jgi:hypothetical protein
MIKNPIAGIFTFIGTALGIVETLSPSVNTWITANIPNHHRLQVFRGMKRCKRYCRRNKLSARMIEAQVNTYFLDLSEEQRKDISNLIIFELQAK